MNDSISKAEVLEVYADLYDIFDDNKEIQKELDKVYDRLNAIPVVNEWISCEDELPRTNVDVLTYRPNMGMPMLVDRYDRYYGEDDNEYYEEWVYGGDSVVAWMPLPRR